MKNHKTIEGDKNIVNYDNTELRDAYYKLSDEGHTITEEFYIFVRNEFLTYLTQQLSPLIHNAFQSPETYICDCYRYYERQNENDTIIKAETHLEGEPLWYYIQSDIEMYQVVFSDYVEKEEKITINHKPNQTLKIKFKDNHRSNENTYTQKKFTEFEIIAYEILQRDKKRNEEYIQMLDNTSSEDDKVVLFRTKAKSNYKQSE